MGESLFSWITLLSISMVSAEQGPSVGRERRSFSAACVREEPLSRPHLTITLSLLAAFSKMPPKMERNMWKKCLAGLEGYAVLFVKSLVSEDRVLGSICYQIDSLCLNWNWNPKVALKCTYFWTSCSKVPRRGSALRVFVSVSSLSAVSLAADPYSAPSLLPSALKAPFGLLPLPSEGGYLAAQMQMKLLDLVEGIRWH